MVQAEQEANKAVGGNEMVEYTVLTLSYCIVVVESADKIIEKSTRYF